ncbi:MAG: CheR family methyltransferase [Vampirovibrionales bacterium]
MSSSPPFDSEFSTANPPSSTPHLDALLERMNQQKQQQVVASTSTSTSTLARPSAGGIARPVPPTGTNTGETFGGFVFPGVQASTPAPHRPTTLNELPRSQGLQRPSTSTLGNTASQQLNRPLLAEASTAEISRPASSTSFGPTMTSHELTQLCALVEEVCSLNIGAEKQYLLESRLVKLLAEYGCDTYSQFISLAKGSKQSELRPKLVDAITTKETLWFRDDHPYETFKNELLPNLLANKGAGSLKIWSAASSTGQEPYSIAMSCIEYAQRNPSSQLSNTQGVQIIATDIAPSNIMLSRLGRYDCVAMGRGLSEERKQRFFTPQGRVWLVKDEVKALTQFEQFNLQNDPSKLGKFDMIFMRNVAIYFSKKFKEGLYERLASVLKPNGYLLIGGTESMVGLNTPFTSVQLGRTTVYQKK